MMGSTSFSPRLVNRPLRATWHASSGLRRPSLQAQHVVSNVEGVIAGRQKAKRVPFSETLADTVAASRTGHCSVSRPKLATERTIVSRHRLAVLAETGEIGCLNNQMDSLV